MIRKTLLTILLSLVTLTYGLSQGVIKNFFKYSTFYTSFSQSNPMVQEDTYAVMDGLLTVVPMEYEPNYTFSFGLRKLARFKYEIKATNFYDGSEVSMSEEANVGNVSGFEYVFEHSQVRLTGQESTDQRYFLRHLSKWMVAELDFLENGRADIKYLEAALKLRVQIGNKFNLTAGIAGRRHPAYTVAPIEDWIEENSGAWWLLAYDYDYVDNWVYTDSNSDGEYTTGEWSDWEWYGPEGNLVAETDSEFRRYQYGSIVNTYNRDIRSQLPNQYQLSAAIGADFYHYSEDFWVHSWVNVMPYHKELGDEEYSYARVAGNTWVDYNAGVVFGANIGKHLGLFAEGSFSEYWGRPLGSLTMGINYVIK
tara:strand:+ start:10977 stop:12074 length:1098 start_codon:yes stop_codon:yes gene_type:complete